MTTQHGPPPRGRRPRAAMAASAIAAVHPRAAPWRESSFHVERARLSPEALVVRRCSASVGRGRCRPMRASGRHWPTVSRGRTVGPPLESLEARTRGGRVEMARFESTMEPRGTVEFRPSEPSRSVRRNRRGAPTQRPGEAAPVDRSRVMTVVSPATRHRIRSSPRASPGCGYPRVFCGRTAENVPCTGETPTMVVHRHLGAKKRERRTTGSVPT